MFRQVSRRSLSTSASLAARATAAAAPPRPLDTVLLARETRRVPEPPRNNGKKALITTRVPAAAKAGAAPEQLQHFLTPAEVHFLFAMVPRAYLTAHWDEHLAKSGKMGITPGLSMVRSTSTHISSALTSFQSQRASVMGQSVAVAHESADKVLERKQTEIADRLEMMRRILGMDSASMKMVQHWNIQRAMEMTRRKVGDTGSPEVQAAVLTVRINNLKEHLAAHKKDAHNRRGLTLLEAKRDKLLKYLKRQNFQLYHETIYKLGL
ncbi:ribosomal protein S15 [Allomyces macrogynus ATCC 38327]|uniref:Ribosomal protein S15 n=1 Tax=Allomyces macrogynus (strain ATCC 38327) TaxID=578462 RepID=A0A0L0S3K2_ALLM3|nr:ribosomal protein S15 [Allomyces macrogynus ATCC 38327]|eukprot:KNE56976.1 ribosomal protein S15 [Allomyces macrogynus ATCC 38327]